MSFSIVPLIFQRPPLSFSSFCIFIDWLIIMRKTWCVHYPIESVYWKILKGCKKWNLGSLVWRVWEVERGRKWLSGCLNNMEEVRGSWHPFFCFVLFCSFFKCNQSRVNLLGRCTWILWIAILFGEFLWVLSSQSTWKWDYVRSGETSRCWEICDLTW